MTNENQMNILALGRQEQRHTPDPGTKKERISKCLIRS